MAINRIITCRECKKDVTVWCRPSDYPKVCAACEDAKAQAERTAFLFSLTVLTLEERLAAIEAWMYDHKHVKHGYIPEPRY